MGAQSQTQEWEWRRRVQRDGKKLSDKDFEQLYPDLGIQKQLYTVHAGAIKTCSKTVMQELSQPDEKLGSQTSRKAVRQVVRQSDTSS